MKRKLLVACGLMSIGVGVAVALWILKSKKKDDEAEESHSNGNSTIDGNTLQLSDTKPKDENQKFENNHLNELMAPFSLVETEVAHQPAFDLHKHSQELFEKIKQRQKNHGKIMLIQNAEIWTGVKYNPSCESMAYNDENIVALGSNDHVVQEISRMKLIVTKTLDFSHTPHLIVPGFIDSHAHLFLGSASRKELDFRGCSSKSEFQSVLKNSTQFDDGTWIRGSGWDHHLWGGELPTREWVDEIFSKNPLMISRICHHTVLANTMALKLSGILEDDGSCHIGKDHIGMLIGSGLVEVDESGFPTGILKDDAIHLVSKHISEPSQDEIEELVKTGFEYLARCGVTSLHNMCLDWEEVENLHHLRQSGLLRTRIVAYAPLSEVDKMKNYLEHHGLGDEWLRFVGFKGFSDGSIGSNTANFFEPLHLPRKNKVHENDTTVETQDENLIMSPSQLVEACRKAENHRNMILHTSPDSLGMQCAIHAIGSRSIHDVLNVYSAVIRSNASRARRLRIEHAQHPRMQDIPLFGMFDIIASMQLSQAMDDCKWATEALGSPRVKTSYPCRTFLDSATKLAFGSDWPVTEPKVIDGISAAVTRSPSTSSSPWIPEQCISVEEALRNYTTCAAYAGYEEMYKGTLETGKLADFVVLDQNILKHEEDDIRNAEVLMTVIGGQIVYADPKHSSIVETHEESSQVLAAHSQKMSPEESNLSPIAKFQPSESSSNSSSPLLEHDSPPISISGSSQSSSPLL